MIQIFFALVFFVVAVWSAYEAAEMRAQRDLARGQARAMRDLYETTVRDIQQPRRLRAVK